VNKSGGECEERIGEAGDGEIPDPVSERKAEVNATFKGDGNVCKSDPE
jgi:hypothetical protein